MPLFRYTCSDSENCKFSYEKLANQAVKDKQECPKCGSAAVREGSRGFSVNTPLDTTKKDPYTAKEIDRVIGGDAESKWSSFEKKKQDKLSKGNVVELDIKPGEKFNPESYLGDENRKKRSEIYSEAVSNSKEEIRSKGGDPNSWDKTGFSKVDI